MTEIEAAQQKLGEQIREIADGYGALPSERNAQIEKCIEDFEEAAGEWVYHLIKSIVLEGSRACEGSPEFLILDEEEDWAGYITSREFMCRVTLGMENAS